jgi:hypothetical protein
MVNLFAPNIGRRSPSKTSDINPHQLLETTVSTAAQQFDVQSQHSVHPNYGGKLDAKTF